MGLSHLCVMRSPALHHEVVRKRERRWAVLMKRLLELRPARQQLVVVAAAAVPPFSRRRKRSQRTSSTGKSSSWRFFRLAYLLD